MCHLEGKGGQNGKGLHLLWGRPGEETAHRPQQVSWESSFEQARQDGSLSAKRGRPEGMEPWAGQVGLSLPELWAQVLVPAALCPWVTPQGLTHSLASAQTHSVTCQCLHVALCPVRLRSHLPGESALKSEPESL